MSVRLYQDQGLELMRAVFRSGKRKVLFWLATGGGKTVVFCRMVKAAVANGKHVVLVVKGRKLVDQASARLMREGVEHGVLMGSHWNYRPHLSVQVCSIDTLVERGLAPKAELIIIDEAHLAVTPAYREWLAKYPDAYVAAFTATPYVPGGLRHLADEIVHPITMRELIDQGYLVDFRYFAPSEPDLSGVHVSARTNDYDQKELGMAMSSGALIGDIVMHWNRLAEGRPTLCFAVNINHSRTIVDRFNKAGIRAEHCDADTPSAERENIIRRLTYGQTKIICNVGIFCTGVDIPPLGCIILARATKSRNLFAQQCGRGTRTHEGKENCILLDHAGNIRRHGFPTVELDVDLDGKVTGDGGALLTKFCSNCRCAYRGFVCTECGIIPPTLSDGGRGAPDEEDGELKEIRPTYAQTAVPAPIDEVSKFIDDADSERIEKGYKQGWQYRRAISKFGRLRCDPYLPDWFKIREVMSSNINSSVFSGSKNKGADKK